MFPSKNIFSQSICKTFQPSSFGSLIFLFFFFFKKNKIIYLTKLGAQLEPKMCVMDEEDSLGNCPATVTELESSQTL